jgi:hypothetical protein
MFRAKKKFNLFQIFSMSILAFSADHFAAAQIAESLPKPNNLTMQRIALLQTASLPPINHQPDSRPLAQSAPILSVSLHEHAIEPHQNLRNYMPSSSSQIFALRTEGYSIAQLQQAALQTNPMLMKKQRQIQAVYGQWLQAGLYTNPTVGLLSEDYSDQGTIGKQGVSVEQQIIRGNKLALNRSVEH